MATARLSFGNSQQSGDAELAGASPLAINVLVDGKGAVRRRPGITTWSGFPSTIPTASQVDGIATFKGDVFYVNAAREVHKVSGGSDTIVGAAGALNGTSRPTFAETKFRLVIAGGSAPLKFDSGGVATANLGGSPPNSTHVAMLSSRLFLNDKTSTSTIGQIRGSGIGQTNEEVWDALVYWEAEARPDGLSAIAENTNELFAFGETTLQVFSTDPTTVIAPGRTRNYGISAPYSVIRVDDQFAWLDTQRRFVISDGRDVQEMSGPIAGTLDAMSTISDCWGFRLNLDQMDTLAWVFPTDGRTFAYQQGGGWAQWHGFAGGNHTLLPATAHKFVDASGTHLVGTSTGQIGTFLPTAYDDLGTAFKAEVLTGFEDHGSTATKHCECLRLVLKRGQSSTAPVLMVSWRDDLGPFCDPIPVSLGTTGDYIAEVSLRSLGVYRRRQWKMEMSAAAEMVLVAAEETFSAGGMD